LKSTEELFEREGVTSGKELERKYSLSYGSLRRRFELNLPLDSPNFRNGRHHKPKNAKGGAKIRRDLQGEIREDISLSWRELYDWELEGAQEWLERVKKVPNITKHEILMRNSNE